MGNGRYADAYQGYYTQEQMRDFVAYCAKYHIQVVPEIEMPGHEVAAISVYPELTCQGVQKPIRTTCGVSDELLCPGNDFTYEFLGNVFKELADIFLLNISIWVVMRQEILRSIAGPIA